MNIQSEHEMSQWGEVKGVGSFFDWLKMHDLGIFRIARVKINPMRAW
jgi:hypothetical protein